MFHIALSNEWSNYGLKKQNFELTIVSKSDSLVLSEWTAPQGTSKVYEKIILASKDQHLYGIAYISDKQKTIKREFFSNYIYIDGLYFPTSIAQISYNDNGIINKLTTYSNIKIKH